MGDALVHSQRTSRLYDHPGRLIHYDAVPCVVLQYDLSRSEEPGGRGIHYFARDTDRPGTHGRFRHHLNNRRQPAVIFRVTDSCHARVARGLSITP